MFVVFFSLKKVSLQVKKEKRNLFFDNGADPTVIMQFSIRMRRGIRKIAIGSDPFELTTVTVLGRFALLGKCGLQFATHQITILINCKL